MIGLAGAFNRFGLGPRPGDLAAYPDIRAALRGELDYPDIALIGSPALLDTPGAFAALTAYNEQQARAQATPPAMEMAPGNTPARAAPAPEMTQPDAPNPAALYRAELAVRLARFQAMPVGFVERLVAFWTNHFAIEAGAGQLERVLVGVFEREAIRPYVLGNFRDMLGAATQHPAMLSYLDNAQSIGPNSPAGLQNGRGLNENHARELLELHTIGVDAGYTQDDVTSLARILTGWGFVGRTAQGDVGTFRFRPGQHEPGPHLFLGVTYPANGQGQGEAVLDMLAEHPATARHIAFKLVRHFVADEPPVALVDRLAEDFVATGGDLRSLALTLVDSDEAFVDATKIKPPQLFLWSALRALELELRPQEIIPALQALGQPMWDPPSPEGFSDESATWLAPDAMTSRLDFAQTIAGRFVRYATPAEMIDAILGPDVSADSRTAILQAESVTQATAILLMSPEFQRM